MTYTERKELEALSVAAFGTKHAYQKRMTKPSHYATEFFGDTHVFGKRVAGYANLEQITQAMVEIIAGKEKDNV